MGTESSPAETKTETEATDVDKSVTKPGFGDRFDREMALTQLFRWYHVPVLAVVMVFMFWTRVQNYGAFLREDGQFWFLAIDSWYHWRTTEWTVQNFPWRIGLDPWTGYPDGSRTGQFGTLFDQLVATVAMIIGLGNPSTHDIVLAALITVPALAALVAIPTYYMGKRLGNRPGAIAGVLVLALTSGTFFRRSIAGMFQHHVAEVLFMAIAVLAMMVALRVAEEELPIWELFVERNWPAIKKPFVYSVLAGIATTVYIWTWPPGVVLVGIFGVFFVIYLAVNVVRAQSPDPIAFVGAVSMSVVAVGTALAIQESGFRASGFDYLPPILALAVAGGCIFMAWLARMWERQGFDPNWYPGGVGVAIVASLVVLSVLLPDFVSALINNVSGRLVPFGYSPGAQTVAEVQPPSDATTFFYEEYGLAFFLGLVAYPLLLFRPIFSLEQRAEHVLVVIWTLFLLSMALTQVRFNYYFVLAVAVLNAHVVGFVFEWMRPDDGIPDLDSLVETIQPYHVAVLAVVVLLLFMPLLPPMASQTPVGAGEDTFAPEEAQPWQDAPKWEQGNQWVNENTPAVGNYAGAGNEGKLDYFGSYTESPDGTFEYPEGAYGILSWWDYGHFITTQANRIPHSNPFQQNVQSSSAFLTAQNESQAELYLDAIAAGESPDHESDLDELEATVEDGDLVDGIQYVMIDDLSAAGKFGAITQWTGPDYMTYLEPQPLTLQDGQERQVHAGGAYYDTMLARLYLEDADGLSHYRLIHEIPTYSIVAFDFANQRVALPYDVGTWGEADEAMYSQLEAARETNQQPPGLEIFDGHLVSSLKTFERVEGATLSGVTEPEATVVATLQLESSTTERTFEYEQVTRSDEDGQFELTVSYPTEETLGPEDGYAASDVRMSEAADGYEITVQRMDDDFGGASGVVVPEKAVQTGETIEIEIEE